MSKFDTISEYYCKACDHAWPKEKWIVVQRPQRGYDLIMCPFCYSVRGVEK